MKCREYLEKILKNFQRNGDSHMYSIALENMPYFCEDYKEYISYLDRLEGKNGK